MQHLRRCLAALLAAAAAAQQPDAAALAQRADAAAVAAMHAYADALQLQKQYGRATQLRREIVQEYAPGDAKALAAIGFVQIGEIWRRDANKLVIEKDLTGDARAIKKLEQEWDRTQRDLAQDFQRAAEAFAAAGQAERAIAYWKRVVRFRPGDKKALAAMRDMSFDGIVGSKADLQLLRKGRAIAQGVAFLKTMPVHTEEIAGGKQAILERAGVPHHGVRSEHFEVWGTLPLEQLTLSAQYAERSLLLCRTMFGAWNGEPFEPRRVLSLLCVGDRGAYQKVLDACADQFRETPDRLRFLKEDVDLAFVRDGSKLLRLYLVLDNSEAVLLDQTVRGVAQDAAMLETHGLWEGLGHAICGFFFGRTLTFLVEQQQAHTVSTWQPRPLVPDMAVWQEIAAESAWAKNDTPTSRIVLLHAAKFTNEERVKAWAIVDWLLRRAPELLFALDACKKQDDAKDPPAVEAAFLKRTKLDLRELDEQWRVYWGSKDWLRKAMAAAPRGSEDAVKGAQELGDAVNRLRCDAGRGPIGFYVAESQAVRQAHEYVAAVLRAEKEKQKNPKADVPMPEPPATLCSVLSFRGTDPAAAVRAFASDPGLRDLLVHPGRQLIGCSKGKDACVLDPEEESEPVTGGVPLTWPADGQRAVPAAARVEHLGPVLAAKLQSLGWGTDGRVGMPLTLHLHRALTPQQQAQLVCRVRTGTSELTGTLSAVQDDASRGGIAGCYCFVPKDPLPAGAQVTVEWSLPDDLLPEGQVMPPVTFTTE